MKPQKSIILSQRCLTAYEANSSSFSEWVREEIERAYGKYVPGAIEKVNNSPEFTIKDGKKRRFTIRVFKDKVVAYFNIEPESIIKDARIVVRTGKEHKYKKIILVYTSPFGDIIRVEGNKTQIISPNGDETTVKRNKNDCDDPIMGLALAKMKLSLKGKTGWKKLKAELKEWNDKLRGAENRSTGQ